MAKKKSKIVQKFLSPERFLKERMRMLEIGDCYVNDDIFKVGYGNVVVSRRHTGGNVSYGVFLVDTWCLGVKYCSYVLRVSEEEFEQLVEHMKAYDMRKATYEEAHNIIYGAVAFAEEAGIKPCSNFSLAQYFLEEDTDDVPLIEYNFGKNGKHSLVANSMSEASKYLPTLKKNLGDDFDYMIQTDDDDGDEDEEGEDEFYDYDARAYTYFNHNLPTEIKLENSGLLKMFSDKQNALALPEEEISKIMAMPPGSLRKDLENIVLYGLRVLRDEDDSTKEYKQYSHAMAHAVAWLSVVGNSTTSLEAALETLKVDMDTFDEIFGDAVACYLLPTLVKLGKDALPRLEAFLYETGFYFSRKTIVFEALVDIAYRWEDKRNEVEDMLRKFLSKAECDGTAADFTDYHLNGMAVCAACDLRAVQLFPIIERLYKDDLVEEYLAGSIDSVKECLHSDANYCLEDIDLRDIYATALRTFGK